MLLAGVRCFFVEEVAVSMTEDHLFGHSSDREWQRADGLDTRELILTTDGGVVTVNGMDWATRTRGFAYNLTYNGNTWLCLWSFGSP